MSPEFLVVRCGGCSAVWAIEYESEKCDCAAEESWGDDQAELVEADSFREAVAIVKSTHAW